jgi:serine/threonine protein phosphatase PrpC
MAEEKVPSEGGSGGKRGHSQMEHGAPTTEIKTGARKARRAGDDRAVAEGLREAATPENAAPRIRVATRVVGAASEGQDRVATKQFERGFLLVLADGAGGTGGGARAAELVVARALALNEPPDDCCSLLRSLDRELERNASCGMTTTVLAFVARDSVHGASVGDSEAWLLTDSDVIDLTAAQDRKPLLGSGRAAPAPFGPVRRQGRLLLASDGLFNYTAPTRIAECVRSGPVEQAAQCLLDAARLRDGSLNDDVSVIVAE